MKHSTESNTLPGRVELAWKLGLAVLLAVIIVMVFSLRARITDTPGQDDGRQNVEMAYNLAYFGVISASGNPEESLAPTNFREPFPVISFAAHIKLRPELSSGLTAESINQGHAIVLVKRHNLLWSMICLFAVAGVVLIAVKERLAAISGAAAAIWLTYRFFLLQPLVIDRPYTEVIAGALLACISLALIRSLQTRKWIWFGLSGLLMGLLALTKAMFLYVGLGVILSLLVVYLVRQSSSERKQFLARIGIMALFMAAVVMPWLVRNRIQLGTWAIAGRGGKVLYARATKNQMTDTEFAGAFYAYAPPALKARMGNWLGFSEEDLEEGGRLQRLNRDGASSFGYRDLEAEWAGKPEEAISFYRTARAEKVRLEMYYRELGMEDPSMLAEEIIQERAKDMILADPVRHLKMTLVFLWRGIWIVDVRFRYLILGVPILWVMGLGGLVRRNSVMIGVGLPAVGVMSFHALFTHYIPRYSMILVPVMMAALIIALMAGLVCLWRLRVRR